MAIGLFLCWFGGCLGLEMGGWAGGGVVGGGFEVGVGCLFGGEEAGEEGHGCVDVKKVGENVCYEVCNERGLR